MPFSWSSITVEIMVTFGNVRQRFADLCVQGLLGLSHRTGIGIAVGPPWSASPV